MRNIFNIIFSVLLLATGVMGLAKNKIIPSNNTVNLSDTIPNYLIEYSSKPFEPLKLVFDYSHRSLPSEKIGKNIVSGSWTTSEGRYGWNDFVHTNTLDPLFIALKDEFQLYMNTEPISKQLLSGIDALVIFNPDNPNLLTGAKVMSEEEIELLKNFVNNGGSLMVMINAVGKGRGSESFESVQLRKLVNIFGLDWKDVDTHYSDIELEDNHPYFYDIDNFHYGAGATIKILNRAESPEVLLDVYSNKGYTDRQVQGHGIVMVRPGKGKFMLVGDVGSWTGNLSRPWAENEKFLKQLFQHLKPSQGVNVPKFNEIDTFNYKIDVTGLHAIPVANSLSEIETKGYTFYKPRELTELPYYEVSTLIDLIREKDLPNKAVKLKAEISDLSGLIQNKENKGNSDFVSMEVSRQGKPSHVIANGFYGSWLQTEVVSTIGLIPSDGIRPGDQWIVKDSWKLPIIRASDLAPIKEFPVKVTYVNDEMVNNTNCRYFRSAGSLWLDDANIIIADLLPEEEIRRIGGSHYKYFSEHGGKLLYNKEQWLDIETGLVIKSRIQTRIIAWIQDLNKPVGENNAEIDNDMIVSLAHVININLIN